MKMFQHPLGRFDEYRGIIWNSRVHSRNRPYCVILSRHYRGFSMTLEGFSVRVEGIDLQDAVADRA